MTVSPTLTDATVPTGASMFEYGMPALARADLAISQELVNFAVPTGLNWKLQASGSAVTTTGLLLLASSSAGLPK
jgi:hypothetical protein